MRWMALAWSGLLGAGCTPGDTDTGWEDTAEDQRPLQAPGRCGRGTAAVMERQAYPSIAAALEDVMWDDTVVWICPGVHTESLHTRVMVDLRSSSGEPSDTILDGQDSQRILHAERGVLLDGLTLRRGLAERGGAIYSEGLASVYNSVLTDNTALVDGGAVASEGMLWCHGCTVESNRAEGRGGAFYSGAGVSSHGSTYRENTAAEGGAIYSRAGPVDLDECELESNQASLRGGALVLVAAEDSSVEECVLAGNQSQGDGGAMAVEGGQLLVDHTDFDGNHALGAGGALRLTEGMELTLRSCAFLDHTAASGGAVSTQGGALTLRSSTFEGNQAEDGGALHADGTELTMTQSSLVSNTASSRGAGLYLAGEADLPQVRLFMSEISDNTAAEGALYVAGQVDLLVDDSSVLGNTDTHGAVVLDGTPWQMLSSLASDWGVGEEDNQPADVAGLERALGQDETFVCVQGTEGLGCSW